MAITVPAAGQVIDAVTFGAPVANAINGTPWVALPLNAPWAGSNPSLYGTPAYRKILDNRFLALRGIVGGGTKAVNIAVLPAAFRPLYRYELLSYTYAAGITFCQLVIQPDGVIRVDMQTGEPGGASLTCIVPMD